MGQWYLAASALLAEPCSWALAYDHQTATARNAARPSRTQRTSAITFTPGGGGSSPSTMDAWSCGGEAAGDDPRVGRGSKESLIATSVEFRRVERLEGTQGNLGSYGRFEIGERVVETRASHHDFLFDVEGRAAHVEDGHQ